MEKWVLSWLRGIRKINQISTWAKFKLDIKERFEASNYEDKLPELSRLQQTSSMAQYLNQFEELLNEVEEQSEGSLITFFIGGLQSELSNDLRVTQPQTLWNAFTLAKIYETNRLKDAATKNNWKPYHYNTNHQ